MNRTCVGEGLVNKGEHGTTRDEVRQLPPPYPRGLLGLHILLPLLGDSRVGTGELSSQEALTKGKADILPLPGWDLAVAPDKDRHEEGSHQTDTRA